MKKLSTTVLSALLVLCVFTTAVYTSCTKDACEGITCQNKGTCTDGKCNCPTGYTGTLCETKTDPCAGLDCKNGGTCTDGKCKCKDGYEGTNCEIETRTLLFKVWIANDVTSSGGSVQEYKPEIKAGATTADITISNFSNSFYTSLVKATLAGTTITIPSQNPDRTGYILSGTGTYNATNKTITWNYIITSPAGNPSNYAGTWK